MFLVPLQELPSLGRNPVYIYGLAIFAIFQAPIVSAKSFGLVLAFRFLTGFTGSPALATGGASMGDVFSPSQLPYVVGIWSLGAVAGPITGPIIGGFGQIPLFVYNFAQFSFILQLLKRTDGNGQFTN